MKCKAGDLALVIYGNQAGQTVTCLELEHSFEFWYAEAKCGPIWKVDRSMRWFRISGELTERAAYPDKWLMPIRPPEDKQDATPMQVNHEVTA